MNALLLQGYFQRYQTMARTTADALWNQWRCWSPWHIGVTMMQALAEEAPPKPSTPAASADTVEKRAMERIEKGFAPPPEIHDIRNRGKIDWSKVPDWARAADPELFEGGHEG